MLELDGITVFVKVVQAGSFTLAARQLGMPNTTVSSKIARLEKRLGVTLIQRTTRKLNITPAGQAYFKRCLHALEEIQAGESELAKSAGEPQGLLRVTASVDVAHSILPPIVRLYLKKYPKTSIDLVVTNRFVDLVAEGVDVAIRAGELDDSSLIAKRMTPVQGGLWASAAYLKRMGTPRALADLAQHDLLVFSPFADSPFRLTNGTEVQSVPLNGRISADDFETLRTFIQKGDGIGPLPNFLGEDPTQKQDLVRVLPKWHWSDRSFSLVYPSQRFLSPKLEAFIQLASSRAEPAS
jgi:DNA-binding transcriptional LysR family regulator